MLSQCLFRYKEKWQTNPQMYTTKPGVAYSMEKQCQLVFADSNVR